MTTIPTSWERTTIADLCTFGSGTGFGPSNWSTAGWPIIRIQNLNGSTDFNYFAGEPDPDWIVEPGELLFAWAGVKGVSFGPTIWRGPRGVLNQHIYRVRASSDVHLEWLYLQLLYVTELIEAQAHGFKSSLVHVRKSDITTQICYRPSFGEQEAMAAIVSTWDRGIRQLTGLIAAKLHFKQGLMQQLLTGQRRLKASTQDAWDHRLIASFLTESRLPGSHGGDAKKLTVKLYGKGVIPKSDTRAGSAATKYYKRQAGQFIYSKLDFLNGAFGIVPEELDGYESTLDLPAFDIGDTVDPSWFRYFVIRESFYKNLLGLANGGRKARRVNPDDLLKVSIPFPPKTEQRRIAHVLQMLDQEIDLLGKQLDAVKQQKKGLMQKLLTGEVRVKLAKGVA
jgi:type I restriction enzyme, S subunit